MIEDIFDEVKKYAEKRMVSEDSIFVDDIIEDTIEDQKFSLLSIPEELKSNIYAPGNDRNAKKYI